MQLFQSLPAPLQWLVSSFSSSEASRSILPFIPRPVKWFALFLFVLNARSWPGVWHARVFNSVLRIRASAILWTWRGKPITDWWASVSPIGRSVFPTADGSDKGAQSVLKSWAAPDDCDWNGHLSNSCYAKNLDPARMQACIDWFPAIFGDGVWMALGGAHYHYIREIPINTPYEIRMSIGGWEDKWIYFVAKFVSHPKKGSKSKSSSQSNSATTIPSITTPSTPLVTEPSTPGEPTIPSTMSTLDASRVDTKLSPKTHDDDGALIHCIAVSTYCFKHGRVTVPPTVVLAMSGFSLGEGQTGQHPPPSALNENKLLNGWSSFSEADGRQKIKSSGSRVRRSRLSA
ncbi:hypothetical protein BDV93DRAFT_510315 [Ceratobasidium sp. AG-I]|nr:hypothetical protein BDV93DRAFT_510315 [Ceratobasidium sp. AG-I]